MQLKSINYQFCILFYHRIHHQFRWTFELLKIFAITNITDTNILGSQVQEFLLGMCLEVKVLGHVVSTSL